MQSHAAAKERILRPPQVRGANRAVVLQLLRHYDSLSRADIARQSGLSEGTVSRIIAQLTEERLVGEDGAENSTGGRPGKRLQLDPSRLAMGVEIENFEMRCSIATMRGRIIDTRRFHTPEAIEDALKRIVEEFAAYGKRYGRERIEGIGVSVRGIVNSDTGVLQFGNRLGWADVPIKRILEQRLRVAVFVQNNVRAATLGEYNYGSLEALGGQCFLLLKIDEGVGIGIVFSGKLYHGTHMSAGEFGQMVVAASGGPERHDRPGCLERLVCNTAVCDRYAAIAGGRRQANLGDATAGVRRIAQMALAGDAAARQTVMETGAYLGIGIANVVWGLNADVVIVDGVLADAWELVEPAIRGQFPDRGELLNFRHLALRRSSLGGEAALIGTATLPFTNVFATGNRRRAAEAAV